MLQDFRPQGLACTPSFALHIGESLREQGTDAGRLGLSPRTVVRFHGRDGERLEVELSAGTAIDLAALAEAFWHRRR